MSNAPVLAVAGAATTVPASPALEYRPQIDALRAFAVAGVLVTHFLPADLWLTRWVGWGGIGVRLFFTISGYLITSILLRGRTMMDTGQAGVGKVMWRFYVRRFLRIFPIFYLTIFVATLLDLPNMRSSFWWHVTYLSNFWIANGRGWILPGHFWSLAVEEHFYLVWPALVLCVPKRWLKPTCVGAILLALVFRLVVTKLGGWLWAMVMMPACLDTLAIGALLAMVRADPRRYPGGLIFRWTRWAMISGVFLWIATLLANLYGLRLWGVPGVLQDFALALIFVWLVDRAAQGFTGTTGAILSWQPLLAIGKISYGIYLIHQFVPAVFEKYFHEPGRNYTDLDYRWRFVIQVAVTLAIAALSWHLFEKPINNLKRYFPYGRGRSAPPTAPA